MHTLKLKFLIAIAIFCLYPSVKPTDTKEANEFIIAPTPAKKKKMSSNDLKEEIGQKTKQMFDQSTQFSTQLGKVQCTLSTVQQEAAKADKPEATKKALLASATINQSLGVISQEIASIQKICSSVVEKLIDNHKPFKKASKIELEQTLEQITTAHQTIQASSTRVSHVHSTCKSVVHIDKLARVLGDEEKKLKTMRTALNNDACLKHL